MNMEAKPLALGDTRPSGPILSLADLRPADVLLLRGDSRISDMIIEADGGNYSHASLWSGASILETTLEGGVEERPVTGRRDVYRYRYKEHGLTREAERRIVDAARKQLGRKYDTAEIHMLSVVFSRAWPFVRPRRSFADGLLDLLGGPAAPRLRDWLQRAYARAAPRICSELVALAYFEAEQRGDGSRPYALLVVAPDQRSASHNHRPVEHEETVDGALEAELKLLKDNAAELLWSDPQGVESVTHALKLTEKEAARGLMFGHLAVDAVTGSPVSIVTPADLQFSPSLAFVGVLDVDG